MIDNRLFEKYDGLIFDMDGTLIDTMPVHARLSHYARCRYATRTFK